MQNPLRACIKLLLSVVSLHLFPSHSNRERFVVFLLLVAVLGAFL